MSEHTAPDLGESRTGASSSWSWRRISSVLVVLLAIPTALVATCELRDRASKPDVEAESTLAESAFEIDAVSLVNLYNSGNQIAANDQVLGRLLRVRGEVLSVSDDRSLSVYLRGPEDWSPPEVRNVNCLLDVNQRSLASSLTTDQVVTVIGTGAGVYLGDVRLDGCRIVSR